MEACKTGNVKVVEELLEGGADPNQVDEVRATFFLSGLCDRFTGAGEQECSSLGLLEWT